MLRFLQCTCIPSLGSYDTSRGVLPQSSGLVFEAGALNN